MKKFLLSIILFIMFIPLIVNANGNCTIEKGNGKNIGDEIKCGTESFYVIDNKQSQIKALAKYNLMTNIVCDLQLFDEEYDSENDAFNAMIINYPDLYNEFFILNTRSDRYAFKYNSNGKIYGFKYCYHDGNITNIGIQNSKATAYKEKNGELDFPFYGLDWGRNVLFWNHTNLYLNDKYGKKFYDFKSLDEFKRVYNEDYDFEDEADYSSVYNSNYLEYLEEQGLNVIDIRDLTLTDLNEIIKKINNSNELPLDTIEESDFIYRDKTKYISPHYVILDLKEYIPEKYDWLYGTSYWLNTVYDNNHSLPMGYSQVEWFRLLVLSTGDLCMTGNDECGTVAYIAGRRPLITIPTSEIGYLIKTKTDGNGTIEVIDRAVGGESIQFKLTAKKGLKLAGLTIITDSGEKIVFNEENILTDSSGVYSISTNKFTMPYENVTIEARWKSTINVPDTLKNPNTGTGISIIIMFMLIISTITYIVFKRKINYIMK